MPRNNNYWSPPRFWRVQCRYNRPLCCPLLSDGYDPTLCEAWHGSNPLVKKWVQTSGTVGQSCSYILRPIVTMRYTLISYHFNLLVLPFHKGLYEFLEPFQHSVYLLFLGYCHKKKHGFQSDCYLPYPKDPQRHLNQFVFVGEQLSWCRGSKQCISDVGILISSFPNVGRWVKLSRL